MNLDNVYYLDGREYRPFPEWARFFFTLGTVFGKQEWNGRLVAGLALPVRDYAAVLLATGIIVRSAQASNSNSEILAHFQELCSLDIGTALIYRRGNRKYKADFAGVDETGVEKRIKIRVQSEKGKQGRNLTHILTPALAQTVSIAPRPFSSLPQSQKGRTIQAQTGFLSTVLGTENVQRFVSQSHLNCLMIGPAKSLEAESTGTLLATRNQDGKLVESTLQEVLRVRRLVSSDGTYRSEISTSKRKVETSEKPDFVVFDGATGFRKWRDTLRNSHWIVLLSRTDSDFKDAVDLLNQEYLMHGSSIVKSNAMPDLPPGVEAMFFEEKR